MKRMSFINVWGVLSDILMYQEINLRLSQIEVLKSCKYYSNVSRFLEKKTLAQKISKLSKYFWLSPCYNNIYQSFTSLYMTTITSILINR